MNFAARLPIPNGGICRLEDREFELCSPTDAARICFPSATSSTSSSPVSGAVTGTGSGLVFCASKPVDKVALSGLMAPVLAANQSSNSVRSMCYVNEHMLVRASCSLSEPVHLVAIPIEIKSGLPLAMELVLIVPETMAALKDFEVPNCSDTSRF